MRVSRREFFKGLSVNERFFMKIFRELGVRNFLFDCSDLQRIADAMPVSSYKSARVQARAEDLLKKFTTEADG